MAFINPPLEEIRRIGGITSRCPRCGAILDGDETICDTCEEREYRRQRDARVVTDRYQRRLV